MNNHSPEEPRNAVILRFARKRGRPKSASGGKDCGTPELMRKRLSGETAETLDLCLQRGMITDEQHWCGIHLRWLHTLRHGAPGVRAVDPAHIRGLEIKADDPQWRAAREQEYHEAIRKVTARGDALLLMNICVYNEKPKCLTLHSQVTRKDRREVSEWAARLCAGLDILAALWGRKAIG